MWCASCRRFYSWGCRWRGIAFGFCGPLQGCTTLRSLLPLVPLRRKRWHPVTPLSLSNQCVWEPVCAAALDAMAFGRRMLWAVHLNERPGDPQQTRITRFFPVLSPRRPAPVVRAGRWAAARFWERLQDLAMLDEYPLKDQRWESVSRGHPFLGVEDVPDRPERPRRFVVNMPAAMQQA